MHTILEWVGTVALLGILMVIVPVFFMAIVTIQFRVLEHPYREADRVPPRLVDHDHPYVNVD